MFFAPKNKKLTGVVFDIGTASVSATLFEIKERGTKPNILNTFRRFHKISLRHDATHFSKSTVSQFSAVLKDISEFTGGMMPELYVIGLSSIFYLGKTERMYDKRSKPGVITDADVKNLVERGRQKFVGDLGRDDIVVFETVLMKSKLNGYPVEEPSGKFAEEIELWVHFAATSKELSDRFHEIIRSFKKNADIHFSTFPIVSWSLMRVNIFPEHSVLLVDVGGEITEVTFLIDGVITEVISLPFGVLNILLRIAESEHVELENALSLLKTFTQGALTNETQARIRAMIKKELTGWEEIFERVWQRASRDAMINIKMFFLGGGAMISDLKNAVTPPLLHPDLARGLDVVVISPDAFRDKFGTYCCLEGPGDFGLVSLILNIETQ